MAEQELFHEGSPLSTGTPPNAEPFPVRFRWHAGAWLDLFEKHVEFIEGDIARAKAEERFVAYLSCPLSSRGGGWSGTNLDIAIHTAERLRRRWGTRLWVLNPGLYQLESREGTGLIRRHARLLSLEHSDREPIDLEKLHAAQPLIGGDYLRMWSRVLVEDGKENRGHRFDLFYFLGPSDVWDFFLNGGTGPVIDAVEAHLARKLAIDERFAAWIHGDSAARMRDYVRYYSFRASAEFSLGSHDEHAIRVAVNALRARAGEAPIPAFFDGVQVGLGAAEAPATLGYAMR